MHQFHYQHQDETAFSEFLAKAKARLAAEPHAKALFHLFNDTAKREVTERAAQTIREALPEALIVGSSTSGNILDGAFVDGAMPNLSVSCTIFEDPSTHVEVHQFPFTRDKREEVARAFKQLIDERPWVRAIELITTLIDVGMAEFCGDVSSVRDDIVIFGGGALTSESVDVWQGMPYVFSSAGASDNHAMVLVLYGGDNFHATAQAVYGWKPLGPFMQVTRAEGPVLFELDGKPAYRRYHHYLTFEDDEKFSENSIIFPLAFHHHGHMVIKAPVRVGEDGSLMLTSDLASFHEQCRITYGDPATILHDIQESARALQAFAPEAILALSCAARKMYWGPKYISRETLPFQSIAPTFGFYTGGEFSREKCHLLHHNVTLVVVGLREGEPAADAEQTSVQINALEFSRQMAIVNSLAAFVGVTSSELEEAYRQVERMAKTDGLTGVANRGEIERRIEGAIAASASAPLSLVMFDLDDFKAVNDAYGHKAGDDVLKGLGALLMALVDEPGKGASGRWGGEEFMVLLPGIAADDARTLAESLRSSFAEKDFHASGRHTMSVGVAQLLPGETADLLCSRVDKALYAAKRHGKNCVVVA